jgi:hypothetical protein
MLIIDIAELTDRIKHDPDVLLIEQFKNLHLLAQQSRNVGIKNAQSNWALAMIVDHEMFHKYNMYSIEPDESQILIHQVR